MRKAATVVLMIAAMALPTGASAKTAFASWYGPGLYGNSLACGGRLTTSTLGVANRWMPCGTMLTICYRRCARVPVVDRGPFISGREFDLTAATAWRVGLSGVQRIRWHY